ncbi:hypothetical protein DAI22_04g169600 [Oryza sativa Japonica Group]|nr:hypothetical protein DAI22_04g169600 [Oryza sativa Japonica Group]
MRRCRLLAPPPLLLLARRLWHCWHRRLPSPLPCVSASSIGPSPPPVVPIATIHRRRSARRQRQRLGATVTSTIPVARRQRRPVANAIPIVCRSVSPLLLLAVVCRAMYLGLFEPLSN